MAYRPPRVIALDYALEAARGRVDDVSVVRKFGENADVDTSFEEIWDVGGSYTGFLTAASAVRIKTGGNAADTSDGNNARSVTVAGLDENWAEAQETIATNGESVSAATSTTFVRVNRAWVETAGVYGNTNAGNIIIETTGGTVVAQISTGKGQTQMAIYTVPAGKTAYLSNFVARCDTNRTIDVRLFQRQDADDSTAPVSAPRLVSEFVGISERIERTYTAFPSFPAKTDIYVQAKADAQGEVDTEFDLYLVTD